MTNDHSVRSPSTDWDGALRRALSESSNTVRAGMREALEQIRVVCLDNAYAARKDMALRFVHDVAVRALAALQLPEAEIQRSDGGEVTDIDINNAEANREIANDVLIWLKARGLYDPRDYECEGPDVAELLTEHEENLQRPSEANSPAAPEAIRLINKRLEDLATANALYGKDQRLSAPDKIERNNREISWLKDLRSTLKLSPAPVDAGVREEILRDITDPIYLTEVLTKIGICDECQERGCLAASQPVVRVDQN